jgi:hypothetical protein
MIVSCNLESDSVDGNPCVALARALVHGEGSRVSVAMPPSRPYWWWNVEVDLRPKA